MVTIQAQRAITEPVNTKCSASVANCIFVGACTLGLEAWFPILDFIVAHLLLLLGKIPHPPLICNIWNCLIKKFAASFPAHSKRKIYERNSNSIQK